MNGVIERLSNIGGGLACIMSYFLNITPMHVLEIAVYGLVGSIIGEVVKIAVEKCTRKKNIDGK